MQPRRPIPLPAMIPLPEVWAQGSVRGAWAVGPGTQAGAWGCVFNPNIQLKAHLLHEGNTEWFPSLLLQTCPALSLTVHHLVKQLPVIISDYLITN